MLVSALGLAAVTAVFGVPSVRRTLLSTHIQKAFAKALPKLSSTEAAALEAGSPGPEAQFFKGEFNVVQLSQRRSGSLTEAEQAFIRDVVDPLLLRLDDYAIMKAGDLPAEVWAYLKENRFFGLCIPTELGGLGFSHRAHSDIVMRIAAVSPSAAVTVMVPNSLGPAELLMHYGTPEQVQHWVPRLARGEEIPCFALTSPWAGSDAASIPDVGTIVALDASNEGRKDLTPDQLGIKLRWDKRYITLAPVATVMGLAFQTRDPQGYLGEPGDKGISVALIPTNHPGVKTGRRHSPMHAAFMNGPTRGEDVVIPLSWLIGGAGQVGQGWRMLMECLSVGRAISLPALGVSMAKQAAVSVTRYARLREQFKMPVGRFHGVGQPLARMGVNAHIAHCTRTFAVDALDDGERSSVASAIAKYHLTELGRESAGMGMDILGGKGICQGPSNLLGTSWQLAPIAITVEGANILTRSLIIFGQGAVRSHPFVLEEMRSARDFSDEGLKRFDKAFWGHTRKMVFDTVRADAGKIFGLWGQERPGESLAFLRREIRQAQLLAAHFSFISEMLMVRLGGSLKKQELLSARLGDVVSGLYKAAAIVRDAASRPGGESQAAKDIRLLAKTSLQHVLHQSEQAMLELLSNTPGVAFRAFLRQATFPMGGRIKAVSDKTWIELSEAMLNRPTLVAAFEEGLLPGERFASGVQKDLAEGHKTALLLAGLGASTNHAASDQWLSTQPEGIRQTVAQHRARLARIVAVDEFGQWKQDDAS